MERRRTLLYIRGGGDTTGDDVALITVCGGHFQKKRHTAATFDLCPHFHFPPIVLEPIPGKDKKTKGDGRIVCGLENQCQNPMLLVLYNHF
jgi:hypothetical protein